jgi:hypothetical protein
MKLQVPHQAWNSLNSQELEASQGLSSMSSALNNEWTIYLLLFGLLNNNINNLEYNESDHGIFRDYCGKLVTVNCNEAI